MAFTFLLFTLAVCFSLGAAIENVLQQDCLLVFSETEFEDGSTESQVECDLRGEDLQGSYHKIVKVDGLTVDLAQASGVESGVTTLFAQDATIDSSGSLLEIPANGDIQLAMTSEEVSNRKLRGILNRKLRTGTKTVLVLRAVASDVATTASESELSDDIFGTSGDVVNLKSQYALCSDGKLQFQPLTTNNLVGEDGVYTVNLPSITVAGATREIIRNAMINQAATDLGASLNTLADHVMACIPPGTVTSWIGNGDVNGWRTMYNDNWCRYQSIQLHEIGHNLNLAHSDEGTVSYDDKSCLMGFSYRNDETPRMCFNGAKTYQLGWYSQYHLDIPITEPFNWNGNLIGFAEKANASSDDKMIVRIITSTKDIYIHFNRQVGMNDGTQEGGNQVLVATRDTGTGYALSNLVAKLNAFDSYTVPETISGGRTITIQVFSISTGTVPGLAIISIQFSNSPSSEQTLAPTPFPTFPPTDQPTNASTKNITPPPTNQPTNNPTGQPTSDPTNRPTSDPTNQPTSDPTSLPSNFPSNQPTNYPTGLPSNYPTGLPSNYPTGLPSNYPTDQPSNFPSDFPTSQPTSNPTKAPTSQPTPNPTKAPTLSTKKPTAKDTKRPTKSPTKLPTKIPSKPPTKRPTKIPTLQKKNGQTVNTYAWLLF